MQARSSIHLTHLKLPSPILKRLFSPDENIDYCVSATPYLPHCKNITTLCFLIRLHVEYYILYKFIIQLGTLKMHKSLLSKGKENKNSCNLNGYGNSFYSKPF